MACKYTSKTVAEIKVIIGALEDSVSDANLLGDQKINHKGTVYEIDGFSGSVSNLLDLWNERLCLAEEQEGTRTINKRFTRFEGYC